MLNLFLLLGCLPLLPCPAGGAALFTGILVVGFLVFVDGPCLPGATTHSQHTVLEGVGACRIVECLEAWRRGEGWKRMFNRVQQGEMRTSKVELRRPFDQSPPPPPPQPSVLSFLSSSSSLPPPRLPPPSTGVRSTGHSSSRTEKDQLREPPHTHTIFWNLVRDQRHLAHRSLSLSHSLLHPLYTYRPHYLATESTPLAILAPPGLPPCAYSVSPSLCQTLDSATTTLPPYPPTYPTACPKTNLRACSLYTSAQTNSVARPLPTQPVTTHLRYNVIP